jgi:Holliday junction resolvase RusA-like endonuclease
MAHIGRVDAPQPIVMLFVGGKPIAKGSFAGVWSDKEQRVVMKGAPRVKDFQRQIALLALAKRRRLRLDVAASDVPVALELSFHLRGRRTTFTPGAPYLETPDTDKLVRTVCDALKGVLYHDDRQVWKIEACAVYAQEADQGVAITATFGQQLSGAGDSQGPHPEGD